MAGGIDRMKRDIIDGTNDIIEQTVNDYYGTQVSQPTDETQDCVNDLGYQEGMEVGRTNFNAAVNGEAPPAVNPMQGYADAFAACDGIAPPAQDFSIPSIKHPILTGLEVALTPTELAPGTVGPSHEDIYRDAFEDGILAGQIDQFDANLDQRFEPQAGPSQIEPPPPIDTPVAGLDYHHEDLSSGDSYSGSSGGGHAGDTTSGGSPD